MIKPKGLHARTCLTFYVSDVKRIDKTINDFDNNYEFDKTSVMMTMIIVVIIVLVIKTMMMKMMMMMMMMHDDDA